MPLALGIMSALLLMTAIRGNYQAVGTLFNQTFFGANGTPGFLKWFGSILGIAMVFRVLDAPKAGETFIALLLIVYFIQNNNVLSQIESAIGSASSGNSSTSSGGTPGAPGAPGAGSTPSTPNTTSTPATPKTGS